MTCGVFGGAYAHYKCISWYVLMSFNSQDHLYLYLSCANFGLCSKFGLEVWYDNIIVMLMYSERLR